MEKLIPWDLFVQNCVIDTANGERLERGPSIDFWEFCVGCYQHLVVTNLEAKLMGWETDDRASGTVTQFTIIAVNKTTGVITIKLNGYDQRVDMNGAELARRIFDS